MKPTTLAFGLAALLAVPAAFADDQPTTESTSTSTTTTTQTTDPAYAAPADPTYTAPATGTAMTTTTTSTERDEVRMGEVEREDRRPRVNPGIGLNVFGAAGTKDAAAWGLGGRVEFVMPFGLTLGGSYQQSFRGTDGQKTSVRPLLGEIGIAIPVARFVEVRPMVGLGYAFVSTSSDSNNTGDNNQNASAAVATAGFDVAPGAKISFLPGTRGAAFEIYTLPKYHFISGTNFLGVELGAGARF
jgi:hypothetical protein